MKEMSGFAPLLFCALKYLERKEKVVNCCQWSQKLSLLSIPKVHTELFKGVLLYFQSALELTAIYSNSN